MKAKQFTTPVSEAPVADYEPIGNFDRPGPFRAVDKRLLTHPVNKLKTLKFFEKTIYDFRLFFSNIPGTGRYREHGKMSRDQVKQVFGSSADTILKDHGDEITVVFVGNSGDDRVMLTPWMMAHRLGHAVRQENAWQYAEQHFFTQVNQILADYYGLGKFKKFKSRVDLGSSQVYSALFNAIGTQRSSREGRISRPYEFLYEMFAQYLGTGTVTLQPLPTTINYGRQVYGRSVQALRLVPDFVSGAEHVTDVLGNDMQLVFDDVLSSIVGDIFVM